MDTPEGRRVALIRGDALNPFEAQVYSELIADWDIVAIGSSRGMYDTGSLPMPVRLLPPVAGRRLVRSPYRRARRRWPSLADPDFLKGFPHAVSDRGILHSAETMLPVSEQSAALTKTHATRLVLTCWETIPFRYDDDPTLARRKQLVKGATSAFIAVTKRARDALIEEGVDPSLITVIPAAVDCRRFTPEADGPDFRATWKISSSSHVILYVGRLIQEKGVVELTRAFARTLRGSSDAHLVFVGNGDQGARVRRAAEALGVGARVHLHPGAPYDALPAIYRAADVVVAPSLTTPYWEEQFGMVLAEAMATGRALVTTESGAIPEVVGESARLVPPYDIDALGSALRDLLGDARERNRLGQAARLHALARYDVRVVAPQIGALYRDLSVR